MIKKSTWYKLKRSFDTELSTVLIFTLLLICLTPVPTLQYRSLDLDRS